MSVPAGTRFIGIQPGVDMVERKSSQANSPTEVYTIEDIQVNAVPYVGATQDVNLGEHELKAGQVEFDQTPTGTAGVAVMRWNDADGTVDLGLKGGNVTLQVGQEQVVRVVNKTATNINLLEANYQAVRVTGAQGQRLKVDLAQATNGLLSAETIGLVTETINNNQEGFITISGLVRNINTTGSLQSEMWADGDIVYLSPTTAGNITNVKPVAPNHLVVIGYVVSAHITQGSIFVKVDNGYGLDELHNVSINSGTLVNNQVLTYESSTQLWKNQTPNTGITVGTTSSTGTDGRVFFQAGGVVQQDSAFFWDNTNKRLGVGATPASTVRLDVRAQGALSTDIAFRVRNSADNFNILQVLGNGTVWSNGAGGIVGNTTFGELALDANTTGVGNTAFGYNALTTNSISGAQTAFGWGALQLTTGAGNTAIGYTAGQGNAGGTYNTYLGYAAGQYGTTATSSVFIGYAAGQNSNATSAVCIGTSASISAATGTIAIGNSTVTGSGTHNISIGQSAGFGISSGAFNIHLGYRSVGSGLTTGNYNTLIGGDSVIGNVSNNAVLSDGLGNIAIRKDAANFVGVGYAGTDTLGAKLDIKAQGALVSNLALRVRNSADTSNLFVVKGNGVLNAANMPTSPAGLVTGDIWSNLGILTIV